MGSNDTTSLNSGILMDEQERTDHLEAVCGSPSAAYKLLRLYTSCCGEWIGLHRDLKSVSKTTLFKLRARSEGYTNEQIDALLACQ